MHVLLCSQSTWKSCAVGVCNAIQRNHLNGPILWQWNVTVVYNLPIEQKGLRGQKYDFEKSISWPSTRRPTADTHTVCSRFPPLECHRCVTNNWKQAVTNVTLCLGPAVNTVYKQAQKQVRPVGRTIYVISAIMAVLIVAFLSIIVYLKVQHRKTALPQKQNTSSGSISKSTQSTVQQPSFDLKQSISEIKSCVFNQVSCVIFSIASCVWVRRGDDQS